MTVRVRKTFSVGKWRKARPGEALPLGEPFDISVGKWLRWTTVFAPQIGGSTKESLLDLLR